MSVVKKVVFGCLLLPVALIASCFGKMEFDEVMYKLPGEVLKSSATPTQKLETATQVAEQLDAYVQPRFEILRDKNFGAFRITYHEHAGIVQLKVDTEREKQQIANVNAANHDYAINLLHCGVIPNGRSYIDRPQLELLYFNEKAVVNASNYPGSSKEIKEKNHFKTEPFFDKAVKALPQLRDGKEFRASDAKWETLMRPVLASKQECLSCHKTSKIGDTLGVMVYAVRKAKRNESTKLSLR